MPGPGIDISKQRVTDVDVNFKSYLANQRTIRVVAYLSPDLLVCH